MMGRADRRLAMAAMLASALPAAAASLLGADEFERMSTGRTLLFSQSGIPYGAEQYLPDRNVIWQYMDGSCDRGYWYEDGPALCFVYDGSPDPQCWVFESREGDFFARLAGTQGGDPSELRLAGRTDKPLSCRAPGLGV